MSIVNASIAKHVSRKGWQFGQSVKSELPPSTFSCLDLLFFFIVIIAKLQQKHYTMFRPKVDATECPPEMLVLMKQCWANNPLERPRLAQVKSAMKESERYVCGVSFGYFYPSSDENDSENKL